MAWGERGQVTTEYMLLISVLVIGLVAASYGFIGQWRTAVKTLADDIEAIFDDPSRLRLPAAAPADDGAIPAPFIADPGQVVDPEEERLLPLAPRLDVKRAWAMELKPKRTRDARIFDSFKTDDGSFPKNVGEVANDQTSKAPQRKTH